MKKLLLAAVLTGLMGASSLVAADTTITQIWVKSDTTIIYTASGAACGVGVNNGMTAEFTKEFLATALTAKSTNATVLVNITGANCKNIMLK